MDLTAEQLEKFRLSPEFGVYQLNEYVHAFRASSDRARYVIFITTAVSLLMLIAAWNYHGLSWSRRATDLYYDERARGQAEERNALVRRERERAEARKRIDAALAAVTAAPATPGAAEELRSAVLAAERLQETEPFRESLARRWTFSSWMRREHDLEWYGGQTAEFYGRGVFVPVPGLGASIHVNDLAVLGGLVLLALTALLWISLIRQHENLYLSLFKIKQIASLERSGASAGDSIANLLYHSLAMAQVLSHPPTLARWNRRLRHRVVHFCGTVIVYFTPAIVHWVIVGQNIYSRQRAYAVWTADVTHVRLGIQVLFAIGITTFCILAFVYARSCEERWRKTFFTINPGLRRIEQRPWAEWVGLSEGDIRSKDMRRIARDLTYGMTVEPEQPPDVRKKPGMWITKEPDSRTHGMTLRGTWQCVVGLFRTRGTRLLITQREMTRAVNDLFEQLAGDGADPRRTRIRNPRIEENRLVVDGNQAKLWKVSVKADVEHPPA